MAEQFDVIVAGLGAMGSAAAYHLARRGKKVLGLDRFTPPHTMGSSHGRTRIIREAYFEHPSYVPLVQRAYTLWSELEAQSGRQLFVKTGGLMIGPPGGVIFEGAKRSAIEHRLAHEVLTAADVRSRFPALQPNPDHAAVWEPRAGFLFPERCIEAHLALAKRHGATLRFDEPVLSWQPDKNAVIARTQNGEYAAERLVISAGAWATTLLSDLRLPLTIERQVLFWFEPASDPDLFRSERCPVYLWEYDDGRFFYGFPDHGDGVKVARHHQGETTEPHAINREVTPDDIEAMRSVVRRCLPKVDGRLREATVCMYTNTPDEHFLIDFHPIHPQVLIASPCSGHGFKFSSAVGEVLADLALESESRYDLSLFRLRW